MGFVGNYAPRGLSPQMYDMPVIHVNQRIEIDSIRCDFDSYPYEVTTFARQFIIRQSNVTERSLVTSCSLQNSVRSDNNPQGFLMEHFLVRENRDIQTYKR